MPTSAVQSAKRSLVKVLLALAALYSVALTLNRDSTDEQIKSACRRVALKAHPDKGGSVEHAQQLNAAKDAWEKAKAEAKPKGRPQGAARNANAAPPPEATTVADPAEAMKAYRIQSMGVLLTYHGVKDVQQWRRFVTFVRQSREKWKVKYWCATLEKTKAGKLHIHMYLQFFSAGNRTNRCYSFEDLVPNASPNDLLGEGICKKKMQESLDRGFFYCWADKIGTHRDEQGKVCVDGNYFPAWTDEYATYAVRAQWPANLWRKYKLTTETYEEYMYACRDGVPFRKRVLEACREKAAADAQEAEMHARAKRIRENPNLYVPFGRVPDVDAWLAFFQEERLRYPILLLLGASLSGKTEFAKSLFRAPLELKIGGLSTFPDKMRTFDRKKHDGIVLDDIRDYQFVLNHQEKLQGKYDALVEFASTPGGHLAYAKDSHRVPIVVTANYDTANPHLLESSDWLCRRENVVVVRYPPGAAVPNSAGSGSAGP